MKYPIGIQNFESLVNDGYLYVDKTALIHELADNGRYYFLSRPRRFGKSLLISTLEAYFSGKKELFKGLAIENLEKDWTVYPILHLDLNTRKYDDAESLNAELSKHLEIWEKLYGDEFKDRALEERFFHIVEKAYYKTGRRVVILVDEYDKPMLQAMGNSELTDEYRSTLKAFYSVLKTQDRYIRFALLTGVTKFAKVSVFSDLNNLDDISMSRKYQTICGITDEEIQTYFKEPIKEMAVNYGKTYEEICDKLKKRYDGYHFRQNGIGIYNPFSLLNTFNNLEFGSYWFETGTPTYLVQLLQKYNYELPNLTREEVDSDVLNSVDAFSSNPIPVIYQSGYLTIKGYDEEFGTYKLGFPNEEVREGFIQYLMPFYMNINRGEGAACVKYFVQDVRRGNAEQFMKRMETLFADTDYKIVGNAELYFQNVFYIIMKMMGFYTKVEQPTSDGRTDMIIETSDYVYIIEFKLDGTPEEALQQIEVKGYDKPFAMDRRKLFKIGVNFSLEKRCIDGWKIK